MPFASEVAPTLYRILISPSHLRPEAELYGFGLQQPLPQITIPLKPTDDGIAIDLQPIFERVYNRGRYRSRIDYKKAPPASALSKTDQQWLTEYLLNAET